MISNKSLKTTVIVYAVVTLVCIGFNYLYSLFGHGVSSPYMTFAFAYSLILGVVGFVVIGLLDLHSRVAFNLYNAGIATLTVGSILRGILDIAGADTVYPLYYFIAGAAFVVAGGGWYLYQWLQMARKKMKTL